MDKTQFIWLGSPQQQLLAKLNVTGTITLADVDIEVSDELTCLGVVLDSTLTFAANVKKRAGSCFRQLRLLRAVRRTVRRRRKDLSPRPHHYSCRLLHQHTVRHHHSPLPNCTHFSQLSTRLHASSPASISSTTSLTPCVTTCTGYQSANASNSRCAH